MPRFSDEWLVDRVLFDYVSGGSCSCCGFKMLIGGTPDLIGAVSDLDTDQMTAETQALERHPWPPELRDQIWADRVRLRQKLKKDMAAFAEFEREHGVGFGVWLTHLPALQLQRLLQLPRTEILQVIQQDYNIHSAYGVVLHAVVEQVANFNVTAYKNDGRGDAELAFEQCLVFDRRGGFTVDVRDKDGCEKKDERAVSAILHRVQTLGGPRLLERGRGNDDDNDDADGLVASPKPSFASDRRIVRLLVARYWARLLHAKYVAEKEPVSLEFGALNRHRMESLVAGLSSPSLARSTDVRSFFTRLPRARARERLKQ